MPRASKRWWRWVQDLRATHPPGAPVRVRRARLTEGWGLTVWKPGQGFTITVDSRISEDFAGYILEHEWAHLLVWDCGCEVDHCDHWALEFARLHREHRHDRDHDGRSHWVS